MYSKTLACKRFWLMLLHQHNFPNPLPGICIYLHAQSLSALWTVLYLNFWVCKNSPANVPLSWEQLDDC